MKRNRKSGITLVMAICLALSTTAYARVTGQFHKSFKLESNGTVVLKNVNGNAVIKVWDRNEVEIDAVKYADNKEELKDLDIEVTSTDGSVNIATKYPDEGNNNHGSGLGVDYTITVPRKANLHDVRIVNGKITVDGVEGRVTASTVNGVIQASGLEQGCELRTVNGKVSADFNVLPADADVKMESVNGPLVVTLPQNSAASIKARVTTGSISNEFGLETYNEQHPESFVKVGDSLNGKLGNGAASITLSVVNGSIRILKSGSEN